MSSKTEQDTFDKLRRASYIEAQVAYTMSCWHLPVTATTEELKEASKEALRVLGWTHESLSLEDMKQRNRPWQKN